ncbi:MAG TPA: sulfatase-like hydrolase/transferase, partial [Methylophilaceae bacterium]|nr:sulfatase-like hydrolase/transferase [Methylophilaceae bacterium]
GLFDDALLARARGKLDQLHQAGQPFNLTLSTIDTHGPWGHLSQLCKHRGARVFEDVVQCSANQVAEFVQFMRKRGYLKDTNVVIMGDHLAMWNPVYEDKLEPIATRHVYNRLISIQPHAKNRDTIVHFDMLPTILEFIGFEVEGGKLGLGYSALSDTMPLPPPGEYEDMSENLLNQSERYLDLWRMRHPGDGAADLAATPSAGRLSGAP